MATGDQLCCNPAHLRSGTPADNVRDAFAKGRRRPTLWQRDGLCRRVDFVVGARAYGTWWEAHPAYLPVNANAGGLWTFEGEGTAWIDPTTERPCRIAAAVRLPRVVDDSAGRGAVDWTYAWGDDRRRGQR